MENITKQDIKEIFIDSLEPFAEAVQKDFGKVNKRLDSMDGRFDSMDGRFDSMDKRFDSMDGRLMNVEHRLANVEEDVKWLKDHFSPFFEKLDEFISLYKKHEEELVILNEQLRRLEERVTKLETKLS